MIPSQHPNQGQSLPFVNSYTLRKWTWKAMISWHTNALRFSRLWVVNSNILKFSDSRPKFGFLSYSSASDQRKEKDQIIPLTFNEYNKKSLLRLFWAWFLVLIWNFCCGLMTLRTLHLTELSINIRSQESKNQRGFFFDQLVLIHTQPKFLL